MDKIVADNQKDLPKGAEMNVRGQVATMNDSFIGLGQGLVGAIVLVYLLMVVNFQSWSEPFIIIMALPGALAGICWMLFLTGTTLSVPALMGAIMCIGVATANSILVISFAKEKFAESHDAHAAVLEAGTTRLRPVHHDRAGHDHRHGARWRWAWARAASKTRRWAARSSAACSWRPSRPFSLCRWSTASCAAARRQDEAPRRVRPRRDRNPPPENVPAHQTHGA